MKSAFLLRRVLNRACKRAAFRALLIGLCSTSAGAVLAQQTYYWDTNPSTAVAGNNVREGGAGTWDNATANFTTSVTDAAAINHNFWDSTTAGTGTDRVIFGGAAGGVIQLNAFASGAQLTASTSAGFNSLSFETNGYTLQGTNSLRFLGTTPTISVSPSLTATINNQIGGTSGLTKSDTGQLILGGVNTYTGATAISGGVLTVSTSTGALSTSSAISLGSGTINLDNNGAVGQLNRSFGSLTFSSGDSTASITRTAAQNQAITFSSLGARVAGATGNFVNLGGVNGNTNGFILTAGATANAPMGAGYFFNGGTANANYAFYNAASSFVRGINWGVDAGTTTVAGGALTTTAYARSTGSTTATIATGQVFTGLNFQNTTATDQSVTLAGTITTNGILRSGNGASTTIISGGTSIATTTASTDLVIRTDMANDALTISTPIVNNGTSALTKSGAGTLTLSGLNTYTGATRVNSGILRAGIASGVNSSAFGNISAVTLANVAGTTLDLNGFNTSIGSLTGGGTTGGDVTLGAATLTVGGNNSSPAAYAGVISGTGALTKVGTGTLTLSGANAYTGVTTVSTGVLSVSTLVNGGTSSSIGASTSAAANLVINGGTLRYTGGAVSIDRQFTLGTSGGTIDNSGTGALTLASNVATTLSGTDTARTLTFTGTNVDNNTYGGILGNNGTGATSLTKSSTGVWVLSGANTYSGATTVNAGTLRAGVVSVANTSGAFGNNSSVILANTAGVTLDLAGFDTQIGSLTGGGATGGIVTLGAGALTVGSNNSVPAPFAGVISGTGSLIKVGTGMLSLSGTNTYTGATTVNAGVLSVSTLADGGISSGLGASTNVPANLVINGGTFRYTGGVVSSDRQFTLGTSGGTLDASGTGALNLTSTVATTLSGTTARTLTLSGSNADNNTYAGILGNGGAGATSVTKTGDGTWVLSGANTYTGATTVSAGTLKAGVASVANVSGAFGNNSALTLANTVDATLDITGFNTQIGSLTGGGTNGGNVTLGAATLTVGGNNTNPAAYAGVISGTGSLTKIGSGTLALAGPNSYTGVTTVNSGVLSVSNLTDGGISGGLGASSSAASNLVLNSGTFRYTGGAVSSDRAFTLGTAGGTVDSSGSGALNLTSTGTTALTGLNAARTLTLRGTNTGSNTYAGVLANNGTGATSLAKSDAGTWVLSGTNSYTGVTTLNLGVLSVSSLANGGAPSNIGASNNTAPNLVLNAGTLQYTGGATSTDRQFTLGTGGVTIEASGSGALNLTATATTLSGTNTARTLTLAGTNTGNNTYAGVLTNNGSGATSLTKTGLGTWVLTGPSTYTGTTTVNGGVLTLNTNTGSLGTGPVALGGGRVDFDNVGAGGLVSESLGALTFNSGDSTVSITRTAAQNQAITFSSLGARGAGATGNFVNVGGTNGSGNGFILTGVTANAAMGAGYFFNGGTANANYAFYNAATSFVRGINWGVDSGTTTTAGGAITTTAYARSTGSTTATIANAQVFTGLNFQNTTATDQSVILAGTITTNGILRSGNGASTTIISGGTSIATTTANSDLVIRTDMANDALSISTPIIANGTSSLTKSGAGTLTLSGANLYTGGTRVNAGVLQIGAISGSAIGTGALTLNGGTISSNSTTARTIINAVTVGGDVTLGNATNNGALTFSGNVDLGGVNRQITTESAATLAGVVSNGALTKAGSSTLTLSGANTYTGATTINGGVLSISSNANLGAVATGAPVNLNNGTLQATTTIGLWNSNAGINNRNVVLSGTGGTFDVSTEFETLSIAGSISGSGGLTKTGLGILDVRQASYTGPTNVNAGVLSFGATVELADSAFNVATNGTVDLNGFSNTIGSLAGNGTITNSSSSAMLSIGPIAGNTSFSGKLTNGGGFLSLDKFGAGTLTLSGATNDYAGTTAIRGGTLALTSVGILPASTQLTISSASGVFDISGISGTTSTVATLSGVAGSTVRLGGKSLMMSTRIPVDANPSNDILISNDEFTYAGTIEGTGGLSKRGRHVQILTGASTFSGPTAITEGKLLASNTAPGTSALGTSNVTVDGTLNFPGNEFENPVFVTFGGTGSITGTVSLLNGGVLAPGASVGTLGVGGANGTGSLDIEFDSSLGIFDRLNVAGTLNLDNFALNFTDLAIVPGTLTSQSYVFATYGSLGGTTKTFSSVVGTPSGYLVNYAFNGTNVALVAVPEPGSLALLVVAGLSGAWYRRTRVQSSTKT